MNPLMKIWPLGIAWMLTGCATDKPELNTPDPRRVASPEPVAVRSPEPATRPEIPVSRSPLATAAAAPRAAASEALPKAVTAATPKPPIAPMAVTCQQDRTGQGDQERVTIACHNNAGVAQKVVIRVEALGVAGVPTVQQELAGYTLAGNEFRTLIKMPVLSRPYYVRFKYTSSKAVG